MLAFITLLDLVQGQSAGAFATHWWTIGTNIAVVIGALAAAGGLFYAGRQVQLLRERLDAESKRERRDRSFELIRRFNDPAFDAIRSRVAAVLRQQPTAAEIAERHENDADFRRGLSLLVNFFEEMGIAWNERELDRKLCFAFFGGIVLGYWDWLNAFIVEHRKGVATRRQGLDPKIPRRIWTEFESMRATMQRKVDGDLKDW